MPPNSVAYDGNSIQTANIIVQSISHESIPTKIASTYSHAHANKTTIPFIAYPSKQITLTGVVVGSSVPDLDSRLDTFKSYFNGKDKYLDISYNGSTRRYIATLNAMTVDRTGLLTYANFTISFIATDPFGQDTAATTAINTTGNTAIPYQPTYTFLGSAPTQRPVITVTFSAMTGNTTPQSVTVSNNATSQGITVNRVWSATDVLVIDTVNRTVTVNGNPVQFSGAFPEFALGAGTFGYTDGFATRTFAFNVTYKVAYL